MEEGNETVHEVPAGVTTDPGTEHVQLYDTAPATGAMLKEDDEFGHALPLFIAPGIKVVRAIAIQKSALFIPHADCVCTQIVPETKPAEKATETFNPVPVTV